MVVRVTWSVHCADSTAFNLENLSIFDRLLGLAWGMLENRLIEFGIHANQVGNAASMVAMPMSEQDM